MRSCAGCMVLPMQFPSEEDLLDRGEAHAHGGVERSVLQVLVQNLLAARADEEAPRGRRPPGQAEYLDLVRALATLAKGKDAQIELLNEIQSLAFAKHKGLS